MPKRIKGKPKFSSIDTPNGRDAKQLNQVHDWNAIPDKDRYTIPHYPGNDTFQIETGEPDPVKKFKEWDKEYWQPTTHKERDKKRKAGGASDLNARVEP